MTAEPVFRGEGAWRELHFDSPDGRHFVMRSSATFNALCMEATTLLLMLPEDEQATWRERIVHSFDGLSKHAVRVETDRTVVLRATTSPATSAVLGELRALLDARIAAGLWQWPCRR
jgi:hypothetical protein